MNLPALDRALLSGRLARSAQARGTMIPKLTKLPKLTSALRLRINSARLMA
jgi:hypothetical protein